MPKNSEPVTIVSEITLEEFQKAYRVMKPLGSKILGALVALLVMGAGAYLAIPKWEDGVKAMVPGIILAALGLFYLVYDNYLFYRSSVKKKYQQLCKMEGTEKLIRTLTLEEEQFTYQAGEKLHTFTYDQIQKKYSLGDRELWICGNQMVFYQAKK